MTAETRDELHTILDALLDVLERSGASIEVSAETTKDILDKLITKGAKT